MDWADERFIDVSTDYGLSGFIFYLPNFEIDHRRKPEPKRPGSSIVGPQLPIVCTLIPNVQMLPFRSYCVLKIHRKRLVLVGVVSMLDDGTVGWSDCSILSVVSIHSKATSEYLAPL